MAEQEEQNSHAFAFFLGAFVLIALTLSLQGDINRSSPQFTTESLKSAKIVHIANAYTDKNNELVGMITERHQVSYQTISDIHIDKSGNISVYKIADSGQSTDVGDDFVITKSEMPKMIERNIRADKHVQSLRSVRDKLIIAVIVTLVIWISLLQKDLNGKRG